MKINQCMKCMNPLPNGTAVCPHCGQPVNAIQTDPHALRPGTILNGTYLVGNMLGQGGFGITYIGFDLLLEQKVAIKEYYPQAAGNVTRQNSSTVLWSIGSDPQKGFEQFLKEARKMAKLGSIPNVVSVKSVFIQNNTAYIVMDYVEGETLLKRIQRTGPLPFAACVGLLRPILTALTQVHRHGIIHRDISPDNIMLGADGTPYLLDLGAAKDMAIQQSKGSMQSTNLVVKHGFSPAEQYMPHAEINSWTDVYAMAATIYSCCTGVLPPFALDRLMKDTLAPHPALTPRQFQVLACAMAIKAENRIQNMEELRTQLEQACAVRPIPPKPQVRNKWLPLGIACALGLVLLTGSLSYLLQERPAPSPSVPELSVPSVTIPVTLPSETSLPEDDFVPVHSHTWQPATWHGAKLCTECGEKEGSAQISVGNTVVFGTYEQDNSKSNGAEALQWRVLRVQDGKALLITDKVVDALPYHDKLVNTTWENCSLRTWLNQNFYNTAFSSEEAKAILQTTVDNSASQGKSSYPTQGGNDTKDRVFLLSYQEVPLYFDTESSRICSNTPYAAARAAANIPNSDNGHFEQSWWWLRSPGDAQTNAMTVFRDGKNRVDLVSNASGQVRPAIWVDIDTPELDF